MNFTIGLSGVQIDGLNTWKKFEILHPMSDAEYSLESSTETGTLNMTVPFFIDVSLFNRGFAKNGSITVDLSDNFFSSTLQVAINSSVVEWLTSHPDRVRNLEY